MLQSRASQQQLACSQTMFCLKYLTFTDRISRIPSVPHGDGTRWSTYVKDGDWSSLDLHTVSISNFSAHTELLSGGISVYGRLFLSLLIIAILAAAESHPAMKTMSLLHLNAAIVYVTSGLQ